jgi:hypothetical protein
MLDSFGADAAPLSIQDGAMTLKGAPAMKKTPVMRNTRPLLVETTDPSDLKTGVARGDRDDESKDPFKDVGNSSPIYFPRHDNYIGRHDYELRQGADLLCLCRSCRKADRRDRHRWVH